MNIDESLIPWDMNTHEALHVLLICTKILEKTQILGSILQELLLVCVLFQFTPTQPVDLALYNYPVVKANPPSA